MWLERPIVVAVLELLLWAGALSGAENGVRRTLEDAQGRSIAVEILEISSGEVMVRNEGGRVVGIALETLSQESQLMLVELRRSEEWLKSRYGDRREVPGDAELRLALIKLRGGSLKTELAIERSLNWLKKTQNADGTWSNTQRVGMTGLALLCFSGHGEGPDSEQYGETYRKGLACLISKSAAQNGKLADDIRDRRWPYEHTIATEALLEAFAICRRDELTIPLLEINCLNSVQWIINNQHLSGGWDYGYAEETDRGGDLSITAWNLRALSATRGSGLEFRNLVPCLRSASDYVARRQMEDGGFAYTGQLSVLPVSTLSGAGLCSLQIVKRNGAEEQDRAARYILGKPKFGWDSAHCDLYGLHFDARAMATRGGEDWVAFQETWREEVQDHQADDGTWSDVGGEAEEIMAVSPAYRSSGDGAMHLRVCLATLILEEFCR